jgi:hypothetical protein
MAEPPPPSSTLDDDIFDTEVKNTAITTELDLGTSTEHVNVEKKQTLNDDLFFSTISDPVDETVESEEVIHTFLLLISTHFDL